MVDCYLATIPPESRIMICKTLVAGFEQVVDMASDLNEVRAKILTLQWDAEKKEKAIAFLSHDASSKLHGLDDVDVFEGTLESLLAEGIEIFGVSAESRLT